MDKSKKIRSLATSSHRRKGIIIGCCIGSVATIALAVGLGVGLTQRHNSPKLSVDHLIIGLECRAINFTVKDAKNVSSIIWSISDKNQLSKWNLVWEGTNGQKSAVLRWTGSTKNDLPTSEINLLITVQVDRTTLTSSVTVESNPFKPSKTNINTVITNSNIQQINSNSQNDVWNGIQLLNPGIPANINEGIFNWGTPSSNAVTLNVKNNNPSYEGMLYITFSIAPPTPVKTDINTVVTNTNIGTINDATETYIWPAILTVNTSLPPNVDSNIFDWSNLALTATGADLSVLHNNLNYTGTLQLEFNITPPTPVKTDINTVVTNNDIGTVPSVTDSFIWSAITAVNTGLPSDVDETIFDWSNLTITAIGADLSVWPTDSKYTGTLQLKFIVTPVVSQTHLDIQNGVLKGFIGTYDPVWGSVLQVPNNVDSIGSKAFDTSEITDLDLSAATNLKRIESEAFNNSWLLSGTVTIPNSVTYIGEQAFNNCNQIANLDLTGATKLETIGNSAFAGCENISGKITIPSSVTSIGDNAFAGCYNINDIGVTGTNFCLANNVGTAKVLIPYNAGNDEFDYLDPSLTPVVGCLAFGALTVPNNVDTVGWNAFSNTSITSLNLASATNLKKIEKAFNGCRKLSGTLTIPSSVTNIEYMAFDGCGSLTGVDLTGATNLVGIGTCAFYTCFGLSGTLTIPSNVTNIGAQAFCGCIKLETLDMSQAKNLTTIDQQAFFQCGLSSIVTNFNMFPTCFTTDVFEDVSVAGTVQNIDKNYASASLLSYLINNCGLPSSWTTTAIDIQYLITKLNLGTITSNSDNDIIAAINTINNTSLTTADLNITNKSATSATVIGKGSYKGSVLVNFTI